MLGLDLISLPAAVGFTLASFSDCPRPPPPSVQVDTQTLAPETDFTPSLADLKRLRVDSQIVRGIKNPHISGITRSGVNVEFLVDYDGQVSGQQACLWVTEVRITVRSQPMVMIAREYPPGTCEHEAVMEHEMKHVRVDHNLVARYEERYRRAARQEANRLGVRYVSDLSRLQAVQKALEDRMRGAIEGVSEDLMRVRNRFQNAVDRQSEYRRVRNKCSNWHHGGR